MRIIAGRLGGRFFESPGTHRTHPMSDKMRGALFNALGDIEGLRVLDAFAGSGAVAFEALSRGADSAVLIDSDRGAQKTITKNIIALNLSRQAKLIKASVSAWLSTTSEKFDIVFCDPPYDDLQPGVLAQVSARVKPDGLLVLSWPGKVDIPSFSAFTQQSSRVYGNAQLVFYVHA